jgi:hypothetical protein
VGHHHAQRPLTKWLRGWSRNSRLLFGAAVAVSLPLAFMFSPSIALFGVSVLIVCWTAVACLQSMWSKRAHQLPHQVQRALVGAAALMVLAGLVAIVENPQEPSSDGDAAAPAPGQQSPEAPGSLGAVPPGNTSGGGPHAGETRPGAAPNDPLAPPFRVAAATSGEIAVSIEGIEPAFLAFTVSVDGSATAVPPRSATLTSAPTAGGLAADQAVPGSSDTVATTPSVAAATTPTSVETPAAPKSAAEKPAAPKPAAEKPAETPAKTPAQKPVADKPATDKPAAETPATPKPAAEKPAA